MMSPYLKYNRAQSAIEFVILASVILFFFVVFFIFIQERVGVLKQEANNRELYNIAYNFADEVTLASQASSGYIRSFSVPPNLNGLPYLINLTSGLLYVHTLNSKYAISIPIPQVIGTPLIGVNRFTNVNGTVHLNN